MSDYVTTDEMNATLAEVNEALFEEINGATIDPVEDPDALRTRNKVRIMSDKIGEAQTDIYQTAHECEEIVTNGICVKRLPFDLLRKLQWIKEQKAALKTAIQGLGTGMPDDEIFHDYYKWIGAGPGPTPEEIIPGHEPATDPEYEHFNVDISARWNVNLILNAGLHAMTSTNAPGVILDLYSFFEDRLKNSMSSIFNEGGNGHFIYPFNEDMRLAYTKVKYTYKHFYLGEWHNEEGYYVGGVFLSYSAGIDHATSSSAGLRFSGHPNFYPNPPHYVVPNNEFADIIITECEFYLSDPQQDESAIPIESVSLSLVYDETTNPISTFEAAFFPGGTPSSLYSIELELDGSPHASYSDPVFNSNFYSSLTINSTGAVLDTFNDISYGLGYARPNGDSVIWPYPILELYVSGTYTADGTPFNEGGPVSGYNGTYGLDIKSGGGYNNKVYGTISSKVGLKQFVGGYFLTVTRYNDPADIPAGTPEEYIQEYNGQYCVAIPNKVASRVYAIIYNGTERTEVNIDFEYCMIYTELWWSDFPYTPGVKIYKDFRINKNEYLSCNLQMGPESTQITTAFVGDMTSGRVSSWDTPNTPEADSVTRSSQEAETEAEQQTGQPSTDVATKILAYAVSKIGTPYPPTAEQNAGNRFGPTYYDCSGLVYKAVQAGGISIPTVSAEQYGYYRSRGGLFTSRASLRPGDLVFWSKKSSGSRSDGYGSSNYIHHVGLIYSVSGGTILIIDSGSKGVQKRNLWDGSGWVIEAFAHPES